MAALRVAPAGDTLLDLAHRDFSLTPEELSVMDLVDRQQYDSLLQETEGLVAQYEALPAHAQAMLLPTPAKFCHIPTPTKAKHPNSKRSLRLKEQEEARQAARATDLFEDSPTGERDPPPKEHPSVPLPPLLDDVDEQSGHAFPLPTTRRHGLADTLASSPAIRLYKSYWRLVSWKSC